MHIGVIVLIILVVLLAVVVAAFSYRLIAMRQGGTAAIFRAVPETGSNRWRHGVIRYGDNSLVFFQLSSLRIGPNARMTRQGIELGERRVPADNEIDLMTAETSILFMVHRGQAYEIALDRGALTAFLSWVESRPPHRSTRGRPAA